MVRKACRTAFTMVELLVVVSIICLLLAILLPTFNAAREMGRRTNCQANLKAMGNGIVQYTTSHTEVLPPASYAPPAAGFRWLWGDMIVKYFDSEAVSSKLSAEYSVMDQPLNDGTATTIRNAGVTTSRYFDCPTLRASLTGVTGQYSIDYAWNKSAVSGKCIAWSVPDSTVGPVRKSMHLGSPSEVVAAMESGQAASFNMTAESDAAIVTATINGAPHLKDRKASCRERV